MNKIEIIFKNDTGNFKRKVKQRWVVSKVDNTIIYHHRKVGIGDGVTIAACVFGIFMLLGGTFESTHMAFYTKPLAFLCGGLRTLQYILGFITG
jgi:hypothetical protein